MEEKRINDELLSMVNGGVLKEGWENTVLTMINVLKAKYVDEGKQKLKKIMASGLNDPTSTMDENDYSMICQFIDDNWNNIR